jgi:hypothetical protein
MSIFLKLTIILPHIFIFSKSLLKQPIELKSLFFWILLLQLIILLVLLQLLVVKLSVRLLIFIFIAQVIVFSKALRFITFFTFYLLDLFKVQLFSVN